MDKRQSLTRVSNIIPRFFTAPVVLACGWELLARFRIISPVYFPEPSAILARFFDLLFQSPALTADILFSLYRLAAGTVIAAPVAVVLGIGLGLNKNLRKFFMPLISLTYPVPKLSVLPLLMILLGIGDSSKVAIIAIGIFYLVLLAVVHGIRNLPSVYWDLAEVYRIPFRKRISQIALKGILPDIYQGCKLGISYGLVMVVASEFIAARNGVGFFMWNAWDQFRIIDVYVALLIFSLLGWMIFALFDLLIARLPWRQSGGLY